MSVDHNLPVQNPGDQHMAVEDKELVKPVAPVKPTSTRRSAIANLGIQVHPAIADIVRNQAATIVSNVKLVRAVDANVNTTAITNPKKNKSRDAALDMERSFKRIKTQHAVEAKLENTGPGRGTKSTLPETGDRGVRTWMPDFVDDDGDRPTDYPFGPRQGLASANTDELEALNPGFKSGDNALQMLGHVAGLFMRVTKDYEYQCLLVNNRLFVAANKKENIDTFKGMTLKSLLDEAGKNDVEFTADSGKLRPYLIAAVAAALTKGSTSTPALTPLQQRGADMLSEYEASHHLAHPVRAGIRSVFNLLQNQVLTPRKMLGPVSIGTAAVMLNMATSESEVILVQPSHKKGWHAEQTLVKVLLDADWRTGALVAGTKLPCLACWHSLNLLPLHGFKLSLVQKPGLYWSTETLKGLTHIAKALKIQTVDDLETCFALTQQHSDDGFKQFMTALRAQTKLGIDATQRKLGDLGLTQDQSQKSFYYPNVDRDPVVITGAPYPDVVPGSPRGSYDTPPGSPQANAEDAEMAEYQKQLDEFKKKDAEYEEAQNKKAQAQAQAKATSTEKTDPTGS